MLTEWFILDKNIVPPIYRLQSIRSKLPNYADDTNPDKKKEVCWESSCQAPAHVGSICGWMKAKLRSALSTRTSCCEFVRGETYLSVIVQI